MRLHGGSGTLSDDGASELLGYAILAGVVMIAAIGISAGAGDLISSCVRTAGLEGAAGSAEAFARTAARSATAGNEYPEALEIVIPQGYELVLLDGGDDWRALRIAADGSELANLRPGSLSLQSPFRAAIYEAGGVFVDDSGSCRTDRKPAIFLAGRPGGRISLYLYVPCLSADTSVLPSGRDAVLSLRCESLRDYEWTVLPGQQVSIEIRTDCIEGWKQVLESQGFTVAIDRDSVTGTRGGIDDVRLATAELQVGIL